MPEFACSVTQSPARWSSADVLVWKVVPESWGGGRPYIQRFKDGWVHHHRAAIRVAARERRFPPELLAGVCWIEVAGDPSGIDRLAFEVRAFDWSGPDWVDRHMTLTHEPGRTSFGAVSMQLRTAAHTLGLNPAQLTMAQLRGLAGCLENDAFNIDIVARHLRQIIDRDGLQTQPPALSEDAVRVAGARYNRGMGLSLERIRANTRYGDFIIRFWPRLAGLLGT
jgi:hypothetical protein